MIDFAGESFNQTLDRSARRFKRAFRLLLDAERYAKSTGSCHWDFAVEFDQFRLQGITENDLRFLMRSSLVEHAHEVTSRGHSARNFESVGSLRFERRSCFVLTPIGVREAPRFLAKKPDQLINMHDGKNIFQANRQSVEVAQPLWDCDRRTLFWCGRVIKQFRQRALNQEIILQAFQEESWPLRIDDPLAPQPCQDMKRRLNDTIKCLNRGHLQRLLRFRGDGTGEGVVWEIVE